MTSTHPSSQGVRRMIFHAPYPLNRQAKSASGIRPVRMRDAFDALGYEVWEVTGRAADRKRAMSRVRRALARGVIFDFCYSESSTMPTTMTEPHHLPVHPDLDFSFLRGLRAAGVRVGLFYRDIYWRFPEYGKDLPAAQKQAALAMYRYDLVSYRTATDLLYLPSLRMAEYVDDKAIQFAELPPGHHVINPAPVASSPLRLLYVGGLSDHYKLHALVTALRELPEVSLTICTREDEWQTARAGYEPLPENVTVVHRSGAQLTELFEQANIAVMYTEPSDYYGFAFPVKLAEYLGWGRPVLATHGTLAGDLIADTRAGWTIPYSVDSARELLRDLSQHPERVSEAAAQTSSISSRFTWEARAQQVADDLSAQGEGAIRTVLLVGATHSIHTARWANGLAGRGIDVHVATIHPLGVQEFDSRVTIHKLPAAKGAGYVLAAPALRRLVERLRPDIINTHYATGYGTLTTAALPADQTPYTLSVWGADVYDVPTKSPAHQRVVRANLARATTICSTSKAMAEHTRTLVSGKRIFLTPFGINMPDFPMKDLDATREDGIVRIGTVKTLHPKYGVDTLIEAFALAHIEAKNTHLDIYGAGPQLEELEQLAYRKGISDHVTFHGAIPHSEVPAAMRALDVYVALSRLDSESFGVAILEASASGVPVVVSDASGPAEVTEDGQTGFIVPRENPQAAADAIVKLARDPQLRREMGQAGRAHVEAHYTWEHSLDTMIDAYRKTIAITRDRRKRRV